MITAASAAQGWDKADASTLRAQGLHDRLRLPRACCPYAHEDLCQPYDWPQIDADQSPSAANSNSGASVCTTMQVPRPEGQGLDLLLHEVLPAEAPPLPAEQAALVQLAGDDAHGAHRSSGNGSRRCAKKAARRSGAPAGGGSPGGASKAAVAALVEKLGSPVQVCSLARGTVPCLAGLQAGFL